MKKIAVVGSGISGLTVSYLLSAKYQVTLFEANDYYGGHTHTHDISLSGQQYKIDTGFIVFNKKTYPNFVKLLQLLNVSYQESEMSFGIYAPQEKYYYCGKNLNTLFIQRKNFFKLSHWQLLKSIYTFNQACLRLHKDQIIPNATLGDFLLQFKNADVLKKYYLLPMISAIWSSGTTKVMSMPLNFFIQFFVNHDLFNISDRPMWYTIKSGSNTYIEPMLKQVQKTYLNSKVLNIVNRDKQWEIDINNQQELFDIVIFACHANHASEIIKGNFPQIECILNRFKYQKNLAILHFDSDFLPPKRGAIAAWNYLLNENSAMLPTLTYHMNSLQKINAPIDFCVTLNPSVAIDHTKILKEIHYEHPIYTHETIHAQRLLDNVNGMNNLYFCGAHLGNGFHEDGVKSAISVAKQLGVEWLC